jgi:hypothetical protein
MVNFKAQKPENANLILVSQNFIVNFKKREFENNFTVKFETRKLICNVVQRGYPYLSEYLLNKVLFMHQFLN